MRMDANVAFREVATLRLKFQMNNRLRLESLAALSRVFREYDEVISDDLLASLVFAVPDELHTNGWMTAGKDYPDSLAGPKNVPPPGPKNIPPAGPKNIPPAGPKNIPPAGPKNVPPAGPKNVPPAGPKKKSSGGTKKKSAGRTRKQSSGRTKKRSAG